MEKQAKKSLFTGMILLTIAVTGILLYVNNAHGQVKATEAEITASTYSTGTDYTGVVTKQFVNKGDDVVAGQTLFYIKSGVLSDQLRNETVDREQLLYPLTDKGEIILKATKSGIISNIDYTVGSFVPANKEVATIYDTASMRVAAKYELLRADYARITPNTYMTVELPDGQTINARIDTIKVTDQDAKITAEIEANVSGVDIQKLKNNANTPVSAKLVLSERSWLSRLGGLLGFTK